MVWLLYSSSGFCPLLILKIAIYSLYYVFMLIYFGIIKFEYVVCPHTAAAYT